IMVVDDEEEIRLGIIKKIPWEEYGFKVIGDAENGQEALEKAEKLRPDIVMTDIKMPFMDGLELGKKLTKKMPESKIIIFSGSDDFEYAQKAIKINVIDYVLKPINSNELIEILKRLKVKLDKEYDDKINLESLHNHYLESLPILREQFLASVIEGRQSKESFINECDKLGVDLKCEKLAVSIIEAENEEENYSKLENREEN
ncbi:response regulator, partial [Clostridium saudiense]|nr:response regulator [Clostridium saudiense]